MSEILANAAGFTEALPALLECLALHLEWDFGSYFTWDEKSNALRCAGIWIRPNTAAPTLEAATRNVLFAPGVGLPGRVWRTGEPAWISDLESDDNFPRRAAALEDGFHAGLGFPIRIGSGVFGVLEFFYRHRREPDPLLLQTVSAIGNQLSQFIQRKRAEQRSRDLVESVTDPFVAYDRDWRFTYINRRAAELIHESGHSEELIGKPLWEAYPWLVGTPTEEHLRRVMVERVPASFEMRASDAGRWYLVRVYPMQDGGVSAQWSDITEQKRSVEESRLLAAASELLVSSLDIETTLDGVCRLVVPTLADYCAIHLLESHRLLRLVSACHIDAEQLAAAKELERLYPPSPDSPVGASHAMSTGALWLDADISEDQLVAAARDDRHRRLLLRLAWKSSIAVPLTVRGHTLGAMTLVTAQSGRRYSTDQVELAQELARRTAYAVDNARLYASANQARLEAEKASQAKMMFLTAMSHELRTPLNAIAGYAELMEMGVHGPVTKQQRESLVRIQRSERHLLSLINDVLNFARVGTGQLKLDLDTVPLTTMLGGVEALVAQRVTSKRLRFQRTDCDPSLAAHADGEKVRQILLNLLSNAIKFTNPGGLISIEVTATDQKVRITVRDTGRGIPPQQLERIFEPFVQLDRSLTSNDEGTGLGLSISRELARAMGGDLTAESALGAGSAFTLSLPRRSPAPSPGGSSR
ncbi:MAG TPA: ATP-binding protein [Gemmatimonadaceae bacterium]|nr:ATP-binding protein [Gemmatimonadaceae bacterium]